MRSGRYYLTKRRTLLLLFLVWIVIATGCATPTASPPPEEAVKKKPEVVPHVLRDIRVSDKKVLFKLIRSGSRSINYTGFKLLDPLRLVVDLFGTVADRVPSPMFVEGEIIGKVETIEFVHESQPVTRVEIGLNRDTAYLIDHAQDEIWVTFYTDYTDPQLIGTPVAPARKILDIQQTVSGEDLDLYIIGNGRFDNYNTFVLNDPPRLVLDLFGVRSTEVEDALILYGPWVRRIRVGLHSNKVRVVFDLIHALKAEVPYQITLEEDRLVVSFKPGSGFPTQ